MVKSSSKVSPKAFTLDFSKWCKGSYTNYAEKCCAWQQALNSGVVGERDNGTLFEDTIVKINDSNIPRKEKVTKLKAEFSKCGIQMNVKNANYGMKKV